MVVNRNGSFVNNSKVQDLHYEKNYLKVGKKKVINDQDEDPTWESLAQIRRDSRRMSIENTALTESLTLYEKTKEHRINKSIDIEKKRNSQNPHICLELEHNSGSIEVEQMFPKFRKNSRKQKKLNTLKEDTKLIFEQDKKYSYFSANSTLIQTHCLNEWDLKSLLCKSNYWLNIFKPNESDLDFLEDVFNIHALTLSDIRMKNTEEKVELYNQYSYFSLRILNTGSENNDDVFRLIMFRDFIITIHEEVWDSLLHITDFLNRVLISSPNIPCWLLYSTFVELTQDAKYQLDILQHQIHKRPQWNKSLEISNYMKTNFDMEIQLSLMCEFLKSKLKILRQLKSKSSKRFNVVIYRLLEELREELIKEMNTVKQLEHILERAQDIALGILNSEESKDTNRMNLFMKRMSEIALIILPIEIISNIFGMNTAIPLKSETHESLIYFWAIIGSSILFGIIIFSFKNRILMLH